LPPQPFVFLLKECLLLLLLLFISLLTQSGNFWLHLSIKVYLNVLRNKALKK